MDCKRCELLSQIIAELNERLLDCNRELAAYRRIEQSLWDMHMGNLRERQPEIKQVVLVGGQVA